MKITELRCENVKRLSAVHITPEGSLVCIGGKNGAGKSSVLDSILYGLTGAKSLPGKPVRNGEEKAEIEITLDGQPNLIVRRRIKDDGKTSLEIEQVNEDGSRAKLTSPQKLLDSLVGSIAFDPLAFTRLRPQEQVELLKSAVGVTTDDIDAETKRLFDERTGVNRDVKQLESQLAGMPLHKDVDTTEEVSPSDILADIKAAHEHNADVDDAYRAAREAESRADRQRNAMATVNAEINELERQLADKEAEKEAISLKMVEAEDAAVVAKDKHKAMAKVDTAPLDEKLGTIEQTNAAVRDNKARAAKAEQLKAAKEQADDLTKQIEKLRTDRIDRLASASWPVEGLGFGDSGVTFNGLPFEQCSSAEQLRISTAVGMSQSPKLPVFMVRDGSLLDADNLELMAKLADQYGAQLWIERVGDGEECTVIIEDGTVAAAEVAA